MTVRLRITLSGSMSEYLFDRDTISVGRAPSNDLVLRGVQAAVRHGALRHDGGGLSFEVFACGQPALLLRDGAILGESDGSRPDRWDVAAGDFLSLGLDATRLEVVSVSSPSRAPWHMWPVPSTSAASPEALSLALDLCESVSDHEDPLRAALDVLSALATAAGVAALARADVSLFTDSDEFFDVTLSSTYSSEGVARAQGRDPLHLMAGHLSVTLQAELEADHDVVGRSVDSSSVVSLLRSGERAIGALSLGFSSPLGSSDAALLPLASALFTRAAHAARARRARRSLSEENRYFRERERRHYLFKELVCESDPMKRTYERLGELVSLDAPALILGEAGAGKELLARALHHLGPRREGVFISLKCGALPDEVLGVELFGCVASELVGAVAPRKGVFELATDGTVYLEEVERLSPLLQGKLSRVLMEGEVRRVGDSVGRRVRARLVASTHLPFERLARSGTLRHDLVLALREHTLTVPALRERREDLMPLARMFLSSYAPRYGARARSFAPDVAQRMLEYDWPGNVRELQSFVETAVLRAPRDAELIQAADLTF